MGQDRDDKIMEKLGRIEGLLVELLTLPDRVRSLEQSRSYLWGGMALLGVAIGYGIAAWKG